MTKLSLTAIILTFNEELHLQRCIDSIKSVCSEIIIVDSFSTDKTSEIAERNNATFIQNRWVNYATQFNWAIDNCQISTDWILRIDADELLPPQLQIEINAKLPTITSEIAGIVIPRRTVFLNREIKRGSGSVMLLRIFRTGVGRAENRWMDEHIVLNAGSMTNFDSVFLDHNLNGIGWWTEKHNGYAIREAIDLLDIELGLISPEGGDTQLNQQALQKRNLKVKYARQPLFWRSFAYFIYRYFFKLGILEGTPGFLWNFLQGWWYRTLVDVKIYEIKKACGTDPIKIKRYLKQHYNISLS